jgi:hypothetical protein
MKHKIVPLLAISFISLTSCNFFSSLLSVSEEVGVYNLDRIKSGDDIEKAHDITINARFKETEPLIPYLTLKQYASLYESHFADGFSSSYTKGTYSVMWSVSHGSDLYFMTEIDFVSKVVRVAGSLEACFKEDDSPRDLRALNYGADISYEGDYLNGGGYAQYDFANHAIKYFSYNNNFYISLGFLDITYSFDSAIYFYYNYKRIVSVSDVETYDTCQYKVDGNLTTVNQEMADAVNGASMPQYLRNYNANLFLYLLDNFYGLKEEKGIKNAKAYCQKLGVYNDLFSSNDKARVQAIADALSYLDDNHTALISGVSAWNETEFNRWTYGTGVKNRSYLNYQLTNTRQAVYSRKGLTPGSDIVYSSDGKTAMFMFDGFIFGTSEEVFNADDSIKDTAYLTDTFFSLIRLFNTLKAKGGVENVILDISTNGGGTVGVMMKILSLVSKNGSSDVVYLEAASSQLAIATTNVDVNADGMTTLDDCFGDDFNIAIMTSDCSFSAANAFACFASYEKICPVIGQKSGGGECAVAIHYLPNGEYLYHSSNLHLGYYDKRQKQFNGFESGAAVDLAIENTDNMYDIEYLNQYVPACF